jgi:hypothetical protein
MIQVEEIERIQRERELELERQRLFELEQERLRQLEIERQRIEEENRLAQQRQQEELEELERRRASRDSLSMTSEDTSYISDDHVTSTPRKPEENDISTSQSRNSKTNYINNLFT